MTAASVSGVLITPVMSYLALQNISRERSVRTGGGSDVPHGELPAGRGGGRGMHPQQ